ncbi:hypothetical protein Bca4012_017708 [Brassica carinata]
MEKGAEKRRIVLVPFPAQGHVTPFIQLGQALSLKGFSITVVQGESNHVIHISGFQFVTIPESLPVSQLKTLGPVEFLIKLNKTSEESFKHCVSQLMLQQDNDIACIIYDELMYFSEAAAKEFKLPGVIFSTVSATSRVCGCVLSKLNAEKFLIDMEDPEVQDKVVNDLHPLTYKYLPTSVIYISLGSKAHMEEKEVLEMTWGLYDSNQPFLWVISESLPEEVSKIASEKGYIVKWAPQNQVLAHPAVGGFWSHCGWNSSLECIVKGVPMICRPFGDEQKLNTKYIESVWRIGIRLKGEVERGQVKRILKRLITDDEGANMRGRSIGFKEKLNASVRVGGSSYNTLDELVKFLET